jgi:putative FmdB family regulatory protein
VPIYDYTCSVCGHVTEVIHGINDHGPRFCPECGAEGSMTKGFTTPAIHYKGSGWAKKDRSTSSRPAATKKNEPTPATPAGSGGDAAPSSSGNASGGDSGTASSGGSGSSASTPTSSSGD